MKVILTFWATCRQAAEFGRFKNGFENRDIESTAMRLITLYQRLGGHESGVVDGSFQTMANRSIIRIVNGHWRYQRQRVIPSTS